MFDFNAMREQMRRVVRARYNLDKANATAARNASLSGYTSNMDKELVNAAKAAYEASKDNLGVMREQLTPLLENVHDETKRIVLKMRYIDGLSAREIAYRLIYSEGYMHRLIDQAEKEIKEVS